VLIARTSLLFVAAALAEIGGCWLIWQAIRQSRPRWLVVAGAASLAAYGLVATAQADTHFGRVLAAYGGVFVAGSLLRAADQLPTYSTSSRRNWVRRGRVPTWRTARANAGPAACTTDRCRCARVIAV
jgi:drug/metabolite transporter superfamily protein YnfA